MSYDNLSFVWYDLNTTAANQDKAKTFYTETIGWKTSELEMGPGPAYTMFSNDVASVGGLGQPLPEAAGIPSHWLTYLRVADVDASAAAVTEHGGKVVKSGFDIPVGRIAIVQDPQGATFALFKEADDSAANKESVPGAMHWNELWSPDIDAVAPFYAKALGFTLGSMDMPGGKKYTLFNEGEAMRGGGMTSPDPSIPAMWLPWIHVDNVDDTVARAGRLGGAVLGELFEVPNVGRMAVLKDGVGAAIGVMTPAAS